MLSAKYPYLCLSPPRPNHFVIDHKQCAMLFRRYVSRTAAGRGRAVLEGVGLPQEDIQMCFSKALQNEEEAIQFGLMKWRDGSGGSTTWAVLIEAMKYAQIGTQHIKAMKDELLKGKVCRLISQSCLLALCMIARICVQRN